MLCRGLSRSSGRNTKLSEKATSNTTAVFSALELNAEVPFIDFHYGKSTADYTSRIIESASGVIDIKADLKENDRRVVTSEYNGSIRLRNEEGYLMGRIDSLDIGCIPSLAGHHMKYVWNSGTQRMYVWMDNTELGYIPFAK